jgi:hypothetical protein
VSREAAKSRRRHNSLAGRNLSRYQWSRVSEPKPDREAVKVLAIAVGVRQAARQLNLNEDTVCSWAKRGHWFTPKPQPPSNAINPQALQAKPGAALQSILESDNRETRIDLSKAARKAARTFSNYHGEKIIGKSQELRHVTATASQLHGWERKEGETAGVIVNIALLNQ